MYRYQISSHKTRRLTQFTGQAKVNDLDLRASRVHADNVLWFEVQVDDVLLVDVTHTLQDLLHVAGTGELRVLEVVVHKAFKELPTCNARWTNTVQQPNRCSILKTSTDYLLTAI